MEISFFKKSELIYWIWLALKLNNQNSVFQGLLDEFNNSPALIYKSTADKINSISTLSDNQRKALLNKNIDEAVSIYNYCRANGVGIVAYTDEEYPQSLKIMKEPPILLYYLGTLPKFDRKVCISVVGTRKMTEYGMRSCYKIAYELASAGAVVVSGMALGIDSIAHAGAMGGRGVTVAVLGCGIDVIYPKQHRKLRQYICRNGAIITAYHPGTPANKHNFPQRNAIISALGDATLVIEAPMKSGALITADHAVEQSRPVYALPGSIEEPMSEGPNYLIKNGAGAITCAKDVLKYHFDNREPSLSIAKLHQGELSSDFDHDILNELGISTDCYGVGSKETPESLLKKLNRELNDNEGQNSDYYAVPKIKKIRDDEGKGKKSEKETPKAPAEIDESVLATLNDDQKKILENIPCDKPTSTDVLARLGYNIGMLMATLTILEIKGLISSLPGGMYIRK